MQARGSGLKKEGGGGGSWGDMGLDFINIMTADVEWQEKGS